MRIEISVVVPTYKRPHLLERCLNALVAQDFPRDQYEIIVADDAGGDGATARVVAKRCAVGNAPSARYVRVVGRHGPAAARNQGWRAARGRVVAFTDDDCFANSDWLR